VFWYFITFIRGLTETKGCHWSLISPCLQMNRRLKQMKFTGIYTRSSADDHICQIKMPPCPVLDSSQPH
jgi:hypothetical protein